MIKCVECGGELRISSDNFEYYCSKCGLVCYELMYATIDFNKDGAPMREFVYPFYYNIKQTDELRPWELRRVLDSKHDRVGGGLTKGKRRKK